MTMTQTSRYLGVSVAWMDKIWIAFGRPIPGNRGSKRFYSEKEIKLLELVIVLRRCGISLRELAEYSKSYVKNNVWDIERFINENPIIHDRLEVELKRIAAVLTQLTKFKQKHLEKVCSG